MTYSDFFNTQYATRHPSLSGFFMKTETLIELLANHADALNQGRDPTAALLNRHSHASPELATLLSLARSLKTAMEPATPAAAFKASLHQQLLQGYLAPTPQPIRSVWWIGAATLGSLLPLAGLLIWFLRRPRPQPTPNLA
jgi:hypothetical protein